MIIEDVRRRGRARREGEGGGRRSRGGQAAVDHFAVEVGIIRRVVSRLDHGTERSAPPSPGESCAFALSARGFSFLSVSGRLSRRFYRAVGV